MLKASIRAILVTTVLALGAISLQGCAYDPYTGAYEPVAYPAYGYYGYYDYYPYGTWGYYPPVYGSVVIGGTWWGGNYHHYHRGHR